MSKVCIEALLWLFLFAVTIIVFEIMLGEPHQ